LLEDKSILNFKHEVSFW